MADLSKKHRGQVGENKYYGQERLMGNNIAEHIETLIKYGLPLASIALPSFLLFDNYKEGAIIVLVVVLIYEAVKTLQSYLFFQLSKNRHIEWIYTLLVNQKMPNPYDYTYSSAKHYYESVEEDRGNVAMDEEGNILNGIECQKRLAAINIYNLNGYRPTYLIKDEFFLIDLSKKRLDHLHEIALKKYRELNFEGPTSSPYDEKL
jgi:hypothetical protein